MKSIILVTGMSGTGKSTVLAELARRGHRVVDTDYDGWSENMDGSEWLWREDRMDTLLTEHTEGALFISGTVSNQVKFYPRFDAIVLLSAPIEVILERVASRETNDYGKTAEQREEIIQYVETIEPLLRDAATFEIDTRKPLDQVATELELIAKRPTV
ncbi:AAA family ATPase [Paenibacillus sp. MZ04-78.2]|uniref:AAA family ATPase n=1 Tax=Paenibacillus sp. MZ04-78.2 TaxID=2962034 RepID=UPI0020B77CB6|nr:AAA family ATPase [Paenibacillus sp. MZ04-78.2]MCP3776625.1 AAA family ATPase [Paenibacillus sp. MZ04-78.2]